MTNVTCGLADWQETGISSVPNARNRVWDNYTYILSHAVFKSSHEYWSWSNHRFWHLRWIPELVTTKLTEPLNHCKHEELETWLCHTIQTTLWCFEPFRHGSTVWQTDRIETAIVASNKVKIIGHLFWILSNYNNI